MCGLCGIAGIEAHWADAPDDMGLPPRQLRYRRIAAANALLAPSGLTLRDFNGVQFVLSDRVGRSAMLSALPELWPLVDGLCATPPDPLDPIYLGAIEDRGRG